MESNWSQVIPKPKRKRNRKVSATRGSSRLELDSLSSWRQTFSCELQSTKPRKGGLQYIEVSGFTVTRCRLLLKKGQSM